MSWYRAARKCGTRGGGRAALTRLLVLAALVCGAAALAAQVPRGFGRGGWQAVIVREGAPAERGGFSFCRLLYTSVRREYGGQGWRTDYPTADHNLMLRLSQFTTTPVNKWDDGELGFVVIRATDPLLFQCPFLFASDVGTAEFDEAEVERLRAFLLKGGFLWVDDFWGDRAWAEWTLQLKRVLPGYEIVELAPDHRLFSAFYQVARVPQVPSIQFWRESGGATSERGPESAVPRMYAVFDDNERLMVLMSHNTDIADGWEREGEDPRFLDAFSPDAYAVGINVAVWSMMR